MTRQQLLHRLCHHFSDATIEAQGENCNFEILIVSPEFDGLTLLKRQQSVLSLFNEELKTGSLHALSIIAKTPHEFNSCLTNH